ncbi:hypothetical protein QW060_23570 [Myroides ceti]|uniref:Uncharacterized protein n=1 Tax=Paenimyroides ceti TaxID=395087 RepID=A0ABT8D1V8_9FLAO|nr:hypothetical protein [Paenimyroides ceti]MDN3709896.1 hypothetical protein [Paenimyroides ceti]
MNDTATKVCIIEAAMAPMITAAILANTHGLKPQTQQYDGRFRYSDIFCNDRFMVSSD